MTRRDILAKVLRGEKVEKGTALEWATTHAPLLSPSIYSFKGRRLNHFCIGSDPEFSLQGPDNERVEAFPAGLRVGLAAGCDQNERLVELRPWPSQSVVAHVAGILTALRWMSRVYNTTRRYRWRAGAFFGGDGMGGHVHFGRKRPTRENEVAALDVLAQTLLYAGLFSAAEWKRRTAGDSRGQRYGTKGDYRLQAHGYEYRTLPSWLESPTSAFICLASSKLTVLDPELVTHWHGLNTEYARNLLRSLAKFYKSRDDDAYLLYHVLTRDGDAPFQQPFGADFAPAWGITREANTDDFGLILPSSIPPDPSEVQEVLEHLLIGVPLAFRKLPRSFVGTLPPHYVWVAASVSGGRHHGFGDLLHNMVFHDAYPVDLSYAPDNRLRIAGVASALWKAAERELILRYDPHAEINSTSGGNNKTTIIVPRRLCEAQTIAGLRAILFKSGLFPLWQVTSVTPDSLEIWQKQHAHKNDQKQWRIC